MEATTLKMVLCGVFVAGFVTCMVFGMGLVLKRVGGDWMSSWMLAGVGLGVAILWPWHSLPATGKAVFADGATRRSTVKLLALPSKRSLPESLVPRVMRATARAPAWQRPPSPLLEGMRQATATRFLLIAAGDRPLEAESNR